MNRLGKIFKSLTAYDHFLVFLIILSIIKIINVFVMNGIDGGLHFVKLGVALIVISTILFLVFRFFLDKKKGYKNVLISTLLILLILSHEDPEPVRGLVLIVLLFASKFLVKYKGANIFNPVVFAVGITTLLSFVIPNMLVPPLDWSGIDIRFPMFGMQFPLPIIPIFLALIFNVARVKRHPLAISFIATSLLIGYMMGQFEGEFLSNFISMLFVGAAIIIEPKSSPIKLKEQIIYGFSIAIVTIIFKVLNIPNAIIMVLLLGNLAYFVFRDFKKESINQQ